MNLRCCVFILFSTFSAVKGHSSTLYCRDFLQKIDYANAEVDGLITGRFEYFFKSPIGTSVPNPYDHPFNSSQKEFLERFGAVFTENSVIIPNVHNFALRVNEHIQKMVERGEIKESEAVYWADTYVKNKRLVFVKYGDPAPENSKPFTEADFEHIGVDEESGQSLYAIPYDFDFRDFPDASFFLSELDFNLAVSLGFLPVFRAQKNFIASNYRVPEASLLHDLAHLGGCVQNPEMMSFFRRVSQKIVNIKNFSVKASDLFQDINERLLLLRGHGLDFPIESVAINYTSEKTLRESIEPLTLSELKSIVDEIIEKYPALRNPLGGALRTGSFYAVLKVPLDQQYFYILDLLDSLSPNADRLYNEKDVIVDRLVMFLRMYHLMAGHTLKDFELVLGLGPVVLTDQLIQLREIWGY